MGNFLTWLFSKKQSKKETGSTIPTTKENNPLPIVTAAEPDTTTTTVPEPIIEKETDAAIIEVDYSSLPPYEPSLDLKDYQYPLQQLLDEPLKKVFTKLVDTAIQLPLIWSVNKTDTTVRDLAELQSILITGISGSGKTNLLHQFILTLLYKKHPSQLKLVLIDYKGLDLSMYRHIEKHFLAMLPGQEHAIISTIHTVVRTLNALCIEMDNRYDLLKDAVTRNITEYNKKFIDRKLNPQKGYQYLPSIVLVVDNVDGFNTQTTKEIVAPLQRLVTMGYKAGVFIILSTTELSYKAIPNELLNLIPERISFRLNSKEEYKKLYGTTNVDILYENGAFHYNHLGKILFGDSVLIPLNSIEAVVNFIGEQRGYPRVFLLPEHVTERELSGKDFDLADRDSLFEEAARLIVQNQIGATSLLQRRLKLGYNRTGRLMDQLEAAGIVGPNLGSKARDVLIKTENELQKHLDALG